MSDARVWGLDLDAAARLLVTEVRDGATSTRVCAALRAAAISGGAADRDRLRRLVAAVRRHLDTGERCIPLESEPGCGACALCVLIAELEAAEEAL